jgi:hypothetical protein
MIFKTEMYKKEQGRVAYIALIRRTSDFECPICATNEISGHDRIPHLILYMRF